MSSCFWLRLGTRASPLALAQAHEVQQLLCAQHHQPLSSIGIIPRLSTADRIQDRPLSEIGHKGLFTKELDEALLAGQIDIAVHSAKDLPNVLPNGLCLAGFLKREDPRDCFISFKAPSLAALPAGAYIGSASLRRQAFVQYFHPDLKLTLIRGNITTRVKKLKSSSTERPLDGLILAFAGFKRLHLEYEVTEILSSDSFLPAAGQGALALMIRSADQRSFDALSPLLDEETAHLVSAERSFVKILDGSCRTPMAAYASREGNQVHFKGIWFVHSPNLPPPLTCFKVTRTGPYADALHLAEESAEELRRQIYMWHKEQKDTSL